jgi:uncharacterized metal-binding protein YceD (DUF177 family)
LTPGAAERVAIAAWLDIPKVEKLSAQVRLSRRGDGLYDYDASFEADVVQACVVTLEPVPAHLEGAFHRTFQLVAATRRRKGVPKEESEAAFSDEDAPEILTDPMADLAAPVLEELSLALDPYPRAPGARFDAPEDKETPSENPFAVLKALKDKAKPKA